VGLTPFDPPYGSDKAWLCRKSLVNSLATVAKRKSRRRFKKNNDVPANRLALP